MSWKGEKQRHAMSARGIRTGIEAKIFGKYTPKVCPNCGSSYGMSWDYDTDSWDCSECGVGFGTKYIDWLYELPKEILFQHGSPDYPYRYLITYKNNESGGPESETFVRGFDNFNKAKHEAKRTSEQWEDDLGQEMYFSVYDAKNKEWLGVY